MGMSKNGTLPHSRDRATAWERGREVRLMARFEGSGSSQDGRTTRRGGGRLASGVVSVLIPGIQDVFVLPLVGSVEEGFVFALLSLLFLPGELLVLGEVLFEAGV